MWPCNVLLHKNVPFYMSIIIFLHKVKCYQVFLSCTECGSKIWNNIWNFFFSLICPTKNNNNKKKQQKNKTKRNKSKFSWLALLFKHLKKFCPIWVSKKRNDKESMICLNLKPSQSFFVYCIQNKEFFFNEKELFKEKGKWRIGQKAKIRFFNCSCYGD